LLHKKRYRVVAVAEIYRLEVVKTRPLKETLHVLVTMP
jgi:hypothetical protein